MNALALSERHTEQARTQPAAFHPDQYVDTHTLANILALSSDYLKHLRCRGGGPQFSKPTAKTVRYRVGDGLEWMARRRFTSTSEVTAHA